MKANYFVVSVLSIIMVCLLSCKNNTSADKVADDKTSDSILANAGKDDNVNEAAIPLLSAAELVEIYDNFDDTHYFENHFADKGMKQLLYDDYKNVQSIPDGSWVTEVYGYNMSYDSSKDQYGERFTALLCHVLRMMKQYRMTTPLLFSVIISLGNGNAIKQCLN